MHSRYDPPVGVPDSDHSIGSPEGHLRRISGKSGSVVAGRDIAEATLNLKNAGLMTETETLLLLLLILLVVIRCRAGKETSRFAEKSGAPARTRT